MNEISIQISISASLLHVYKLKHILLVEILMQMFTLMGLLYLYGSESHPCGQKLLYKYFTLVSTPSWVQSYSHGVYLL